MRFIRDLSDNEVMFEVFAAAYQKHRKDPPFPEALAKVGLREEEVSPLCSTPHKIWASLEEARVRAGKKGLDEVRVAWEEWVLHKLIHLDHVPPECFLALCFLPKPFKALALEHLFETVALEFHRLPMTWASRVYWTGAQWAKELFLIMAAEDNEPVSPYLYYWPIVEGMDKPYPLSGNHDVSLKARWLYPPYKSYYHHHVCCRNRLEAYPGHGWR